MTILSTRQASGGGLVCTRTAASLSATDVQAALNVAVSGDVVCLPAGTGRWSTQVAWTAPANVILKGAGDGSVVGGGNATIIYDDYASSQPILAITTNATGKFTMLGISFRGGTAGTGRDKYDGIVGIGGSSQQIAVYACTFDVTSYSPYLNSAHLQFNGWTYGVVYNCVFTSGTNSVNNAIRLHNQATMNGDPLQVGDQAWASPTNLGSANFVFAEDNVFTNGCANDSLDGGTFVFRYNTFNMTQGGPTLQTHPTGGSQRHRGGRAFEVYANTFNAQPGNYIHSGVWLSAGTGVVWGNTLPSSSAGGGTGYRSVISGHCMRYSNTTYTQTATPNGWGYAGTHQTGTGSNWDGNTIADSGYPALDQIGRGQGQLLVNDFPSTVNNSTGTIAWPNQALEPIYEWANAYSPVPSNPSGIWSQNDATATQNVDYYLGTQDSGVPITFTGATGVGVGTLAARPSSGLTAGVGYWATDTQTLYVATSATTWSTYYQPYTYPHPLRV